MKIAISGSSGYIASNLIPELEAAGYSIIRIKRTDLANGEKLIAALSGTSVVINLAGAPIFQRWTTRNKKEILRSRSDSTQNIVNAINNLPPNLRPHLFISASATGIYKSGQTHTESSALFSDDFVSDVVKSWESASDNLNPDVRKVIFRIGLVLGKKAITIQKLVPLFKLGLGGKIGSGKQPFPFIHLTDAVNAFIWSIKNPWARGTYNLVAPENIDNKAFTRALAQSVNRPAIFTVPAFALKIAFGNASSLLLNNPHVYPERLLNEGFKFTYPDIKSCLAQIVR